METEIWAFFREFGLPGLVVGYFLIKDWKTSAARIAADKEMASALAALKTVVELRVH